MISEKPRKILSNIGKLLYYVVIVLICLIAAFLLFYIISSQLNANNEEYKPKLSIYTIISPSMTPVIKVYDVVINVRVDKPENIKVGDIITYKSKASTSEGMTITHRVIDVSELPDGSFEYQTQGDNNSQPDSLYVGFDQVIGKEIFIIPYLGRIQFLIANQKGWLFLLLIPVSIYTFIEIYKLFTLFGVKKKVKDIVIADEIATTEEQRIRDEEIQARKQRLKEELNINQSINNIPVPTSEEDIATYKNNVVEILDTDELTSVIKAYDDKINELDKAIKSMTPATEEENSIILEEDFLKGGRIKVVQEEVAKKRKGKKDELVKDEVISAGKKKDNLSNQVVDITEINEDDDVFEDVVPTENTRTKIERPVSEDISIARERTIKNATVNQQSSNKKNLNLNPRRIKKVNVNHQSRRKRNLVLNPTNKNKVNRPRYQKTKKKFIVIEKKK